MFYDFPIAIPPNTVESAPFEVEAKLTHGVIHRLEVEFPDWHWGQTDVRILLGSFQLWPSNPGGSFSSNNHAITWNDYYPLVRRPYTLTLQGWNSDDTFTHTVTVRIGILPLTVADHVYGRLKPVDLAKLRKDFGLDEGER